MMGKMARRNRWKYSTVLEQEDFAFVISIDLLGILKLELREKSSLTGFLEPILSVQRIPRLSSLFIDLVMTNFK